MDLIKSQEVFDELVKNGHTESALLLRNWGEEDALAKSCRATMEKARSTTGISPSAILNAPGGALKLGPESKPKPAAAIVPAVDTMADRRATNAADQEKARLLVTRNTPKKI